MPSRLGSAIDHVAAATCCCSNSRSTRSRAGDGSLCATTGSPADLLHRHLPALGERMRRAAPAAPARRCRRRPRAARLGRVERQRAEVEAALLHLDGDLARRHAADVDRDLRVAAARNRAISGSSVCTAASLAPIEHAPAPQVAQLAHGRLGLLGEPHEPLAVVLQHPAGLGQRAVLRRAVEQPLAELVLEPAHRLADGRLRAVHLGRGAREAALLRRRRERCCRASAAWSIISSVIVT